MEPIGEVAERIVGKLLQQRTDVREFSVPQIIPFPLALRNRADTRAGKSTPRLPALNHLGQRHYSVTDNVNRAIVSNDKEPLSI